MRRGHPGSGGWRNDNPRHFKPRSGGIPHYRPYKIYPLLGPPGFPPPGPRPFRALPPYGAGGTDVRKRLEDDNGNPYRFIRGSSKQHRHQFQQNNNRQYSPHTNRTTYKDMPSAFSSYNNDSDQSKQCHINSLGDIDERQLPMVPHKPFSQYPGNDWVQLQDNEYQDFDERNFNQKTDKNQNSSESNKTITPDYIGHRPPSSDHYGSNSSVATDHSNTFSRSVDDTVNIVRKRLMNRNDVQHQTNELLTERSHNENTNAEETSVCTVNKTITQEQPVNKRRIQRQRQNIKSDCDKIKNKIVHQLFKMDKEKIHKLMDNPSSSTKFEYAISSLITESQNSLNRHLRSVAEESLCTSSTEFIHNDNNTIYEDTFMKQMQCILDPQDTVFLEDIKPLVMEELRKVLQLNDFDQRFETMDSFDNTRLDKINTENLQLEENDFQHSNESLSQNITTNDHPGVEHKSIMDISSETFQPTPILSPQRFAKPDAIESTQPTAFENTKPLYERRLSQKSSEYSPARRKSTEKKHQLRRSIENTPNEDVWETKNTAKQLDKWCLTRRSIDAQEEKLNAYETALASCNPSFDVNADQLSEGEDPFAELDKQYHVAVDPSFIADDDIPIIHSPNDKNNDDKHGSNFLSDIITNFKKEQNSSVQNAIKSPLKSLANNDIPRQEMPNDKNEVLVNVKSEQVTETSNSCNNIKSESLSTQVKSPLLLKSLKRTVDQKPLHRKEKRKKSESIQPDNNKQILNKNIIINLTDCTAKTSEKCDSTKSIFNLFFSKDENRKQETKNTEKVDPVDKEYSDKYVKRKQKGLSKKAKTKESDISKRNNSVLTTHPGTRDNINVKVEPKSKLKSIDLFVDLPKQLNSHKAHKNAATTPVTPCEIKTFEEESKMRKFMTTSKIKVIKRHVATQVVRKYHSKEIQVNLRKNLVSQHCQTEIKRFVAKGNQTDLQHPEKIGNKANDTFERMKEIDLEIQVLLQEKFKLYNSLESKDCSNTIPSLGMTVLNVTKDNEINEDSLSEDAIVADFTNIPVEELEQIAFETVEHEEITSPNSKTTRRHKRLNERKSTESPTNVKRLNKRVKTPNISLIEQIITDNRPLEDIISLVDLEDEDIPVQTTKTKRDKTNVCNNFVNLEYDDIPVLIRKKKQNQTIIRNNIVGLEDVNIPIQTKKKKQNKNVIFYDIHDTPVQVKTKVTNKEPKKKVAKKGKKAKAIDNTVEYDIKPCSVILVRDDVNKYFNQKCEEPDSTGVIMINQETDIVEETIVNEFDMLDVSEDIVIGESCEVKLTGDKDERVEVPLSEDIILDNSQSSSEDVQGPNMASNDNQCKMYDYSADESLRRDSITVSGNGDAVLAIECIENNFIVACLDGNVYYFNEDGQLITTLRGSNLAVTCLTIVKEKYGTTVYTGSLDSRIRYYDLETGLEKGPECNVLSPIQTMDRAWDTIFVGTRTGFVLQFECKNNMLIPVSTVKFSEQSILALRALKEGPRKVLLVAARSENVTIKDAQTGLLLRTLEGPKMTVYTLLYEDGKVYCGTSSHQIHVFEYNSGCHAGTHEGGKGAVCLRAVGGLLFAGCYDGCVYVYRDGEARPFAQLRGPGLMLLSLAVRGTKIIAGYKDRSLYIWKIPLAVLQEMIL